LEEIGSVAYLFGSIQLCSAKTWKQSALQHENLEIAGSVAYNLEAVSSAGENFEAAGSVAYNLEAVSSAGENLEAAGSVAYNFEADGSVA
jgi:hypothetical protein